MTCSLCITWRELLPGGSGLPNLLPAGSPGRCPCWDTGTVQGFFACLMKAPPSAVTLITGRITSVNF